MRKSAEDEELQKALNELNKNLSIVSEFLSNKDLKDLFTVVYQIVYQQIF